MIKETLIRATFRSIDIMTLGNFTTLRNFDMIPDESSIENYIDVLIQFIMSMSRIKEKLSH